MLDDNFRTNLSGSSTCLLHGKHYRACRCSSSDVIKGKDCPVEGVLHRRYPKWFLDFRQNSVGSSPDTYSNHETVKTVCVSHDILIGNYASNGRGKLHFSGRSLVALRNKRSPAFLLHFCHETARRRAGQRKEKHEHEKQGFTYYLHRFQMSERGDGKTLQRLVTARGPYPCGCRGRSLTSTRSNIGQIHHDGGSVCTRLKRE